VKKLIDRSQVFLNSLAKAVKTALDLRDFFLFFGLIMLGYGLYLLRPWLGFSVPGLIMVCISLFVGKRGK